MHAKIKAVDYYLPEQRVTNDYLSETFKRWSPGEIEKKVGIRERRIAHAGETALDLAYHAAVNLFRQYEKDTVDFIILCTQSPDYLLPTSACVLQEKLGMRSAVGAFDMNLGCSGYVYGLALANGLITGRMARSVLLITSETYSKHIHAGDLANRTIFGDGAAATVVEESSEPGFGSFIFGTDGKGSGNLMVKNGAMRNRYDASAVEYSDQSGNIRTDNHLFMNGPEIFNFTIEMVPQAVDQVLQKNGMTLDDVDYVIFHQANKFMIEYLRKKIGIPEEKFCADMLDTGNTVSSTIPIALKNAVAQRRVTAGDRVLLCGFGVGYSWGACVVTV